MHRLSLEVDLFLQMDEAQCAAERSAAQHEVFYQQRRAVVRGVLDELRGEAFDLLSPIDRMESTLQIPRRRSD